MIRRVSGVLIPLFSLPSSQSWGIGEFGDLPVFAAWMRRSGLNVLQMLPLNETSREVSSPYSALSAMALDPQFITLRSVPDFEAIGGDASLDPSVRADLDRARGATRIDYARVRAAKHQALRSAFDRFMAEEWAVRSLRSRELQRYASDQAWWLDSYALFRALRAEFNEQDWQTWPDPFRRADADALATARVELEREIRFFQYVQWIAEGQWQRAREASRPVSVFGDYPFLVTGDSADVWTRQNQFMLDSTVGAPPDAFSESGQDWGLPPPDWSVMEARGDEWTRLRVRRTTALFDGFRIDHLVGFYRTYVRPRDGVPYFIPEDEPEQLVQGERLMEIFEEAGASITAEDLGNVPAFVRQSIATRGLPGYRVMRWERDWDLPGQPFRDPGTYPVESVATTGTHDTETLAEWWESITLDERRSLAALPTVAAIADPDALSRPMLDTVVRNAILEALYAARSALLILPIQDLFGWSTRINEPGSVSDDNWTFKLPWPIEEAESHPEPLECAHRLRAWAERHGRI